MELLRQGLAFAGPFFPFRNQPLPAIDRRRQPSLALSVPPSPTLPKWITEFLHGKYINPLPSHWGKGEPLELVTNYGPASRVIAIGDIHGDVDALKRALRLGGVIGDNGEWTGGNTVLVQVGDIVDRGTQEREAFEVLFRLQDEAKNHGGRVFLLLGNHEILNLYGNFKYVNKDAANAFGYVSEGMLGSIGFGKGRKRHMPGRYKAFTGPMMRELGRRCQVAVVVGDSVFVHAGLAPHHFFGKQEVVDEERTGDWVNILHRMNEECREWMLEHSNGTSTYWNRPKFLGGANSPVYARYYSREGVTKDSPACKLLGVTLNMIGAKRMVVGHSIQENGVSAGCREKIWCIDTGMSSAYKFGGVPETLEINKRGAVKVLTEDGVINGRKRRLD